MTTFKDSIPEAVIAEMRAHAIAAYPAEACGLIVQAEGQATPGYLRCTNVSKEPGDFFAISAEEFAQAEDLGEVIGVFHSHPDTVSEPSDADIASCQHSGLPWLIISWPVETWSEVKPDLVSSAPLYGRDFKHGSMDCFGFIQAWYFQELGIELATPKREDGWWKAGQNLYLDNYKKWGFERVTDGSMKVGDVLLMQVHSDVVNHGAVYLGDGVIGHHLCGRLSSRDVYGGYWRRHTTHVMRYKGAA